MSRGTRKRATQHSAPAPRNTKRLIAGCSRRETLDEDLARDGLAGRPEVFCCRALPFCQTLHAGRYPAAPHRQPFASPNRQHSAVGFVVGPATYQFSQGEMELNVGTSKNIRVMKHEDGWQAKRDGARRAGGVFQTQAEAIAAARQTAQNERGELFIHGRDGRIRERDSFGNDPFPPKG